MQTLLLLIISKFWCIQILITSGIQIGHMKMHLLNIQIKITQLKTKINLEFFKNKLVTYSGVTTKSN